MTACRLGVVSAGATLLGILISGPLAVALVSATHPQPPWQGSATFAESYHAVQLLPYAGGIVLVASLVALVSSLHALGGDEERPRTTAALVFTAAFATLILFNYVVQTSFLPARVAEYSERDAPLIAAFTMANPTSLAWGIEMWGWGLFGAATWLVAPVFRRDRLERVTSALFVANGLVSVVGAMWTVARPGWVMTLAGIIAFALWNVLLTVMAALVFVGLRRRHRSETPSLRLVRREA